MMGDSKHGCVVRRAGEKKQKLIVGGGPTGVISVVDFDGSTLEIVGKHTSNGTSPNWLVWKEPGWVFANDENSDALRLFRFAKDTNSLELVQTAAGSSGVVHLEFNKEGSVLVGAAFGAGSIDVWDLERDDHTRNTSLHLRKSIPVGGLPGPVTGRQDSPHPHEALLDPTGAFFVVPDLATDTLLVVDTQEFEIRTRVHVTPSGAGPRHGSFLPSGGGQGGKRATHFVVVCEIINVIKVYELDYDHSSRGLGLKEVQSISTFGKDLPPANPDTAAAGELIIDASSRNLYVSNRLTGDATDSIAHFSIHLDKAENETKAPLLAFVDQVSSGGLLPRMLSLSKGDDVLFSTNQDGELGLVAFGKDKCTGRLTGEPVASVRREVFGGPNLGPQFVAEM